MIQISEKEKCCGCTACYSACPMHAIEMRPDEEGFLYPCINTSLCINCGKCTRICPVLNKNVLPQKSVSAYVAQNEDDKVLLHSTSGGFVDALLKHIIAGGGTPLDVCLMIIGFRSTYLRTILMISKSFVAPNTRKVI